MEIVKDAKDRNSARNITGLLLHHDGSFLQLLEGPEDQVANVFEAIRNDRRHGGIRVLHRDIAPKRLCADWSMGYGRPPRESKEEELMFQITSQDLNLRLSEESSVLARSLIRSFLHFI